ncbi:hypothetical protein [Burkholderia ubonensis]|uniref:hypothetical protein n=1 Tax=Burkholderia ubonensis TaxID=101571 RepID=UPI000AE2DEA9
MLISERAIFHYRCQPVKKRQKVSGAVTFEVVALNAQWGLLRFIDGALGSAQPLETDSEHIVRIHAQCCAGGRYQDGRGAAGHMASIAESM